MRVVPFTMSQTTPPVNGASTRVLPSTPGDTVRFQSGPVQQPVVLLILDGWGLQPAGNHNAISLAQPPTYKRLLANHPWIPLAASGTAVGLPAGMMGNSEVGHLTIGSGRILDQDLPKINKAVTSGAFARNSAILNTLNKIKLSGGTLHLMGLVSDGGVHSHLNHLLALIDLAKAEGIENVRVHAFTDGRDTAPQAARPFLHAVEQKLAASGYSPIATLSGRYYAMDRDRRWNRTKAAYDTIVQGSGAQADSALKALEDSYHNQVTDEFIQPVVTDPSYSGMGKGDGVIFFNFRSDRARQLTQALTDSSMQWTRRLWTDGKRSWLFRSKPPTPLHFLCMTEYDPALNLPVAFPRKMPNHVLASVLSEHGLRQLHTAETEKYAHVTHFLNGGREKPFPDEERLLVPSPKVATYDQKPEMSVGQVTDNIINALNQRNHHFIVANLANPDMVGHTGQIPATVTAIRAVDDALKRISTAVLQNNGVMLLTADHGNAEIMEDANGNAHTAHTTSPVPLVLVSNQPQLALRQDKSAGLQDIAPTVLDLFQITKPTAMTGSSLLQKS